VRQWLEGVDPAHPALIRRFCGRGVWSQQASNAKGITPPKERLQQGSGGYFCSCEELASQTGCDVSILKCGEGRQSYAAAITKASRLAPQFPGSASNRPGQVSPHAAQRPSSPRSHTVMEYQSRPISRAPQP
jgi:hypothetical protein